MSIMMAMYDLDEDGCITRKDMLEIVRSVQRMVGTENDTICKECVDQILSQMDKNCDGKLSKEEFIIGAKNDKSMSQLLSFRKK